MKHLFIQAWPAFIALVVGLFGVMWSGATIRKEFTESVAVLDFPRDAKSFALILDDSCIAKGMAFGKRVPEGWSLELNGSIAKTSVRGALTFNSLKNLIGSTFYVKGPSIDLFLGSIGIKEIKAKVAGEVLGRKIEYQTDLDGPVSLTEEGKALRLHFKRQSIPPAFSSILGGNVRNVSQISPTSLGGLKVNLKEVEDEFHCQEDLNSTTTSKIMNLLGSKWR